MFPKENSEYFTDVVHLEWANSLLRSQSYKEYRNHFKKNTTDLQVNWNDGKPIFKFVHSLVIRLIFLSEEH